MIVYCDNESCEGEIMDCIDTDSRQEWCEETYSCPKCGKIKVHRRDYSQDGLVTSDKITGGE